MIEGTVPACRRDPPLWFTATATEVATARLQRAERLLRSAVPEDYGYGTKPGPGAGGDGQGGTGVVPSAWVTNSPVGGRRDHLSADDRTADVLIPVTFS